MIEKPTKALMAALQRFVFRHGIFIEAHEFDDGMLFVREPKGRLKRFGPHRNFRVFLRRQKRRVHVYTLTCGSTEKEQSQVRIDFPEKALLGPAEAALEYEDCGRDVKRYAAHFPGDPEAGHALFGYVRSESRILRKLLGDLIYRELLDLVRRHQNRRGRPANKRSQTKHPSSPPHPRRPSRPEVS